MKMMSNNKGKPWENVSEEEINYLMEERMGFPLFFFFRFWAKK